MYEIRHYRDVAGRDRYQQWLDGLRDRQAKLRIVQRVNRLATGLFGDCKPCRESVWELCIDWGPGYRVYYAKIGRAVILLLAGGDKRKQDPDIERAIEYLSDYRKRCDEQSEKD